MWPTPAPKDQEAAPQTVRKVHVLLSGILSTAVRWGWLSVSPMARVRAPRAPLTKLRAPEPEEIALALAAARVTDEELHVFLRLSAALGTRRGETAALRWCDIELDAGDPRAAETSANLRANVASSGVSGCLGRWARSGPLGEVPRNSPSSRQV